MYTIKNGVDNLSTIGEDWEELKTNSKGNNHQKKDQHEKKKSEKNVLFPRAMHHTLVDMRRQF